MIREFLMPDLGEGMESAEVVSWLVEVGQSIGLDDPLVEVETDKATVVIPSPFAGVLITRRGEAGTHIHVGTPVASFDISTGDDANPTSTAPSPSLADPTAAPKPAAVTSQTPRASAARAAPATRRRAYSLGIDLETIVGSGPAGRVTDADLDAAAKRLPSTAAAAAADSSPQSASAVGQRIAFKGTQRRVAQLMSEAWSTVPHMCSWDEIDAAPLLAIVERAAKTALAAPAATLFSYLVMATARALRDVPILNATLDEGAEEIVVHEACNIRFAVATPNGLLVPVIRNADQLTLRALSADIQRLTDAARAGTLTAGEMQGGTFTITNYGALGGSRFAAPIIRPPDVAILGFGRIDVRPWVVDGQVVARPLLPYSLSCDHRVINGDSASTFTRILRTMLDDPALML